MSLNLDQILKSFQWEILRPIEFSFPSSFNQSYFEPQKLQNSQPLNFNIEVMDETMEEWLYEKVGETDELMEES